MSTRDQPLTADGLSGWQPIETAPKDGTPILVFCTNAFGQCVATWQGRDWRTALYHVEPTHWQPLPPPPRDEPDLEVIAELGARAGWF